MKWYKVILFCCVASVLSCKKVVPIPQPTQKIFTVSESMINDRQIIHFDLTTAGIHTLTLIDKSTGQVISRERFNGQIGENTKKIYTKSLPTKILFLQLEDVNKNEIGKTTITIN